MLWLSSLLLAFAHCLSLVHASATVTRSSVAYARETKQVAVCPGISLACLTDVCLTAPLLDDQLLTYDAKTMRWVNADPCNCPAGPPGPQGDPGAPGEQGPPGPQGPSGNNSLLVAQFLVYFPFTQTLSTGQSVQWVKRSGPSAPIVAISLLSNTSLVVSTSGTYEVSWYLSTSASNQFSPYRNSTPFDDGTYGVSVGATPQINVGSTLAQLTAGDIVSLRNINSATPVTLVKTGGTDEPNLASITFRLLVPA